MAASLIYIAENESDICDSVKSLLIREGYKVRAFNNVYSVFQAFDEYEPDMLIIDVNIFGTDGDSVCSSIRRKSSVPIIIVSYGNTEDDIIAGLSSGGDHFLSKPFSPLELIARVKSLFRRVELDKTSVLPGNILCVSDITLDTCRKQALIGEKDINLTVMEFSLLLYLASSKNRPVSRHELLVKVWGFENEIETRATDDMMKRIRKKLSDAGSALKIETIWGFGFRIG